VVDVGLNSGDNNWQTVKVSGVDARLNRLPADGELPLFWRVGADELALDGNEADFSIEQLIRLAESSTLSR